MNLQYGGNMETSEPNVQINSNNLNENEVNLDEVGQEGTENVDPNLSEDESDVALGATHADSYEPEMLLRAYEEAIADAINNNDFSKVEKYLIKDSKIYQEQKLYISNQHAEGVTYSLISYDIENIEEDSSNSDEYKLYVKETIGLNESNENKNTETTEYWMYTIISNETELGISNKEIWEHHN
ncbi:TcaA NTF2-like domain-containing protein [Paenibacillus segetis]|uniref:TcaA protein NTF2-like domain-containing protein n=1 Tax=Paenibacillus segetis TaxID=1325360 RepID=A0ABQ1Y3Q6_9BACL|nr:hypothetical protein [Paenibacillus segetis]GGH11076.1 hypothetical protein GCM10008013_02760 [Paenibacillus segetis]